MTGKTDTVPLVGRKIVAIRSMLPAEFKHEGWEDYRHNSHGPPPVLILDDGTRIYPSADSEGNGPGALFGVDRDGKTSFQIA